MDEDDDENSRIEKQLQTLLERGPEKDGISSGDEVDTEVLVDYQRSSVVVSSEKESSVKFVSNKDVFDSVLSSMSTVSELRSQVLGLSRKLQLATNLLRGVNKKIAAEVSSQLGVYF